MVRLLKIKCGNCEDVIVPDAVEVKDGEIQCPTCGATIKIEVEQIIVRNPKIFLDFMREYAEWINEDPNEYIEDTIVQAVASRIWCELDDLRDIAPNKTKYFIEKYNFLFSL